MNVGGEQFRVIEPCSYIPACRGQLKDCYTRPSTRKKAIYDGWWEWLSLLPGYGEMWIVSYNCCFFTIGGELWIDEKHYAFYITYTRQEIWEVIE